MRHLSVRKGKNRAQCALEQDRERLLAVIEAGFGTAGSFNAIVRGVLDGGVWPPEEEHLGHQTAAVVPTATMVAAPSQTPSGSNPCPTAHETPV